jgi:hypothetical protein
MVPVMTPGERWGFLVLTAFAALGVLAFGAYWIRLGATPHHRAGQWTFIVASLLIGFHLSSWFTRWLLLWRMRRPEPMEPPSGLRVAVVTTFVPGAEPLGMLAQSVQAMVGMEYPHDTWVLDEGETSEVAALCRRLGARHFSRRHKPEFQTDAGQFARDTKYGNYNAWLSEIGAAHYDILAAFDPDHIPEPNFLVSVLGYFRDPSVAYVQVPQVYYNQDVSFIARGAAEESYSYYSTHQMASYGMGQPILVGSHNTQRIAALMEVGGLAPHDADDLLITLRYRATRWRGVYLPEILALGTTPVDWQGYLRQQIRWTKSVIDIKLHHLPGLVGRLPPAERFLSLFHGTYYLRSFTLPITYGLLAWLVIRGATPNFFGVAPLGALLGLSCVLGAIGLFRRRFSLDRAHEGGLHWRALVLQFAKWPDQCLATWQALRHRGEAPYALTMKVHPAGERSLVLWPHWLIAAAMAVALLGGLRYNPMDLLGWMAVAVIIVSLAIAESEYLPIRKPWDEAVYLARRRQLADILGPTQWPSVERRRSPRTA